MDPELFAAVFSRTSPRRRVAETTVPFSSFFPSRLGALRIASIESHELFPGPRTDCRCLAFASRKPPTWIPKKGKLCRDRRRFLVVHVLQERQLYTAGFKETFARGVLPGEFRAEALVVASLCFTAIITRTLLDAAGDYHQELSNAFALGAFNGKASVVYRLSTRRLRRIFTVKWIARVRRVRKFALTNAAYAWRRFLREE